jgi:acyl carrier protein
MLTAIRRWYSKWVTHDECVVERVFAGRDPLSDEDFYAHYFSQSEVHKDVAIGVRRTLIEKVPLDMRRLTPDDQFGGELKVIWSSDSLADVEMICEIEKQFDISIRESDGPISTMGQLIQLADRKVKTRQRALGRGSGCPYPTE